LQNGVSTGIDWYPSHGELGFKSPIFHCYNFELSKRNKLGWTIKAEVRKKGTTRAFNFLTLENPIKDTREHVRIICP
jgi:hypothetical protein